MRSDLDELLTTADPATHYLHSGVGTVVDTTELGAALDELVSDTSVAEPLQLPAHRTRNTARPLTRAGRWVVPVAVGLVAVGGTAAATAAVLDFFSPDSPITVSEWVELPGGATHGCDLFYNVVPADGVSRTDANGLTVQEGSPDTFDASEFDAVVAFLAAHDWETELAGLPWQDFGVTQAPDGSLEGSGSVDTAAIDARVADVLAHEGLNSGGSAHLVATVSCGVGIGDAPGSGS